MCCAFSYRRVLYFRVPGVRTTEGVVTGGGNGGLVYSIPEWVGVRGVGEQEGQTSLIFELALLYIRGSLL